jgi:hypothetical protein
VDLLLTEYLDSIYLNLSKTQKKGVLRRLSLLFYIQNLSVIDKKNKVTKKIKLNVSAIYNNKTLDYSSKRPLERDLAVLAFYKKIKKENIKNTIFVEAIFNEENCFQSMLVDLNKLIKNNFY